MRWKRIRRIGGGIGVRRRILGRMRWVKEAPKEKEKVHQDVGFVEIPPIYKGIAQKVKGKEVPKEEDRKGSSKGKVKDSQETKDTPKEKARGIKEEAKEKDSYREEIGSKEKEAGR